MMNRIKQLLALSAVLAGGLFISSCTDDARSIVPVTDDSGNSTEAAAKEPAPGVYVITRFIDTGGDETAQFNGYTFTFEADGGFIATTSGGQTFNGSWELNNLETVMTLNIAGNEALDDLDDDDWTVGRITNTRIRISAPGPDVVMFTRM
jgi:hypothetical protein